MKTIIQIPRIPLFTEIEEPQSYAIYIFGTDNRLLQDADTFGDALARYLNEYTLTAYNARMKKLGMKPLTNLTSDMEDGK